MPRTLLSPLARIAIVAACATVPHAFAQGGFDLPQLMQLLAQAKVGKAQFVERRSVAMLEQTLESSGRLSFEAPDTFVRETLEPRREKLVVVGNQLTLTQGSRVRTLALDATPEAAVMVEAIRGTLTGNRDALEHYFKASVSGDARGWRLDLTPRDVGDGRVLGDLEADGSGRQPVLLGLLADELQDAL